MTNQGLLFILDNFFAGVAFTAPSYYLGHGINYTGDETLTSTLQTMTNGAPNYPATNPFQDAGQRIQVDWSGGAVDMGNGLVEKAAPPVIALNYGPLQVSSGYNDLTYQATTQGSGPSALPAILYSVYGVPQAPAPAFAMGDVLQTTITEVMICK